MPRRPYPRHPIGQPRVPRPNGRRSTTTPRSVFRRALLRMLAYSEGHQMRSRDVRAILAQRLAHQFTAADMEETRRGDPKWVNNLQWEKKTMVMEGLIESVLSAGHGTWRLTDSGINAARRPVR